MVHRYTRCTLLREVRSEMQHYTTPQALKRLGLTKQSFFRSGLADAIEWLSVGDVLARHVEIDEEAREYFNAGPYTRLWPANEIEQWAEALHRLRGLIALGLKHPKTPLRKAPQDGSAIKIDGEWVAAHDLDWRFEIEPGRFVVRVAPWCNEDGEPVDRAWCPELGVIEIPKE